MAQDTAKHIKLGIFVTLTLMIFIVGIYNIGSLQNLFGDTFTLHSVFDNVKGLQKGNNVRFSGINIGTVSEINIASDTTVMVTMTLQGDAKKFIHRDAIAIIGSDGLVGNMVINIDKGQMNLPLVTDGNVILSYNRLSSDEMLNTLNVTNENAALLTNDLLQITGTILHKNGILNTLLEDTLMSLELKQTVSHIKRSTAELEQATRKFNRLIDQLNNENSLLTTITSDSVITRQFHQTFDQLGQSTVALQNVVKEVEQWVDQENMRNGPLKTLLQDSILSEDLKQTMQNLNTGTEKFNENMEALKHSFPFKKYYKKKRKEEKRSNNTAVTSDTKY